MAARISTWVRWRPVSAFYILAFAITWLAWIPQALYSRGLFPFDSLLFYVLGGIGPGLAALIVLHVLYGEAAYEKLFAPLLRWRVGVIWYIAALFGYAAIWLASSGMSGAVGPALEKVGLWSALLPGFLTYLIAAIPEEVGWRGFALPRLQARYSALASSLIIGVVWALWHLPLLLNRDNVMSTYPVLPFFFAVIARAIVYTWLYNSTRGSVLIVTIFHAVSNTIGHFVPAEAAVTILVAALIVIVFGPATLSRQGERIVQADHLRGGVAARHALSSPGGLLNRTRGRR